MWQKPSGGQLALSFFWQGHDLDGAVVNPLVQGGQLRAMPTRQVSQVRVSYLFRSFGVRVQRDKVVWNALGLPLGGKPIQQLPGLLHRRIHGLLVRADSQEAEFSQWTKEDAFVLKPNERFRMSRVIFPDGGQQKIDIQKVLHGKSARASFSAS